MEARKIVYRETGIAALGVLVCTAVMIGVFALIGEFELNVLWGSLLGVVLSISNFFFMAIGTSFAADKAQQQDVKAGQLLVRSSYMIRLVILFVILFACAKSGIFDLIALVLPLVFVQPVLTIAEFFRKKGAAPA